ncbi:MAG: hypothetical protein WCN88_05200 [Candidatus Falkowbacteria bacterium]
MLFFKPKKGTKEETKKNLLQNPKILEVNLIKDEVKIAFDWNKNISILMVVLFIASIFVAEIYFGLDWWQKQELVEAQSIENDIIKVNRDISKIKGTADEALSYKNKSIEVGRLLDSHIYWSNFFNWLEKNTLSTVKFDSFGGSTNGLYSLSAKALSYAEVSWQVKAFLADPMVKKVEVLSVNSSLMNSKTKSLDAGVNFALSFELDPAIFKK